MELNGKNYEGSGDEEVTETEARPVLGPDALQESVDHLNNSVADDIDDTIGYCTECKNQIADGKFARSPFFNQGGSVPCPYCGGVTIVVRQRFVSDGLNVSLDRNRGLGSTRHVG